MDVPHGCCDCGHLAGNQASSTRWLAAYAQACGPVPGNWACWLNRLTLHRLAGIVFSPRLIAMTLLVVASAFLFGVFLGDRLDLSVPALLMFASTALLIALLLRRTGRSAMPGVLVLCVVLGSLRAASTDDSTTALARYHGLRPIQVEGFAETDAEPVGTAMRFPLRVERIQRDDDWVEVEGTVLVTTRQTAQLVEFRDSPYVRYGDRLRLDGPLTAPPDLDDFDYPAYLARQGIGSVMSFPDVVLLNGSEGSGPKKWLFNLRRSLSASLQESVPEPQASLGQALLLGVRDNIPENVVKDFRTTGTSHLLAISGLHVGILLMITLGISTRVFGRRRQYYLIAPLVAIWMYAVLAGLSPSVVRAAIMGTAYLVALGLGRPRSILPVLGLAAAVMVAISPNVLWSISFQLSFTAMAGIATMAEPVSRWLQNSLGVAHVQNSVAKTVIIGITGSVGMSVAAIVATMPLTAFYFQQASLVGLPVTLVTLPMLPFALVFHGLASVLGLVFVPLGIMFGWLAWAASAYIVGVVSLAADFPIASLETGKIAPSLVVGYYGLAMAWYVAVRRGALANLRSHEGRSVSLRFGLPASKWLAVPMTFAAVLVWMAALNHDDQQLHVVFADVGQGDSMMIVTPSGRQVLVDGGPGPLDATRLLGGRLPFLDRSLDVVVLSHGHADHVTGLVEVLRRYDVEHIIERETDYASPSYLEWKQAVGDENAVVIQVQTGHAINLGDGVVVEVLAPPESPLVDNETDVNNASVVLRVVYGEVSFLLTGDIFANAERGILTRSASVQSTILKVAHHGSRTSSLPEFVERVSPMAAVISVGEDNRFDHPHAETIETLRQHVSEDQILQTSERGTIEFITDGTTLRVKTER